MKNMFFVLFCLVSIMLLSNELLNTSLAYSYDIDQSVLFYKDDYEELTKDVEVYVSGIDDYVIPNSSFLYSDKLVENYDFLVRFAIDYVLGHKEYYSGNVKWRDNCLYIDEKGRERETTDYISLEKIYEITDFYFGVRDFSIINEEVCLDNNYISLSDYTDREFLFNVDDVLVKGNRDKIEAIVTYSNDNQYLYSFVNVNNVLKLLNVEVIQ